MAGESLRGTWGEENHDHVLASGSVNGLAVGPKPTEIKTLGTQPKQGLERAAALS